MSNHIQDCCKYHFSWNAECIDEVNKDDASFESVSTTTSSSTPSFDEANKDDESEYSVFTSTSSSTATTETAWETTAEITAAASTQFESAAESSSTPEPPRPFNTGDPTTTEQLASTESEPESFLSGSFLEADATISETTSTTITSDTPTTSPSTPTLPTTEVSSQADAFMSAQQFEESRPIQTGQLDVSVESQAQSTLQDIISSAISISQDTVPVQPFYVEMLPLDSGYGLKVKNPKQMKQAVSAYLISYLTSLDGWSYSNALRDFELDCKKSDQVLSCEGNGIFEDSSTPLKRDFNDLIFTAFAGRHHEEFLEFMYPSYVAGDESHIEEVRVSPSIKERTGDMAGNHD